MLKATHKETINEYRIIRDTGYTVHVEGIQPTMSNALSYAESLAKAKNLSPHYYYIDYVQTNRYTLDK